MPIVFRHRNLKFFFYSNEVEPRQPMHIHVRGPGSEAKIWLEPALALIESKGFKSRDLADIMKLMSENRQLIERAWREHFTD